MNNMELTTGCYIDDRWGHYSSARLIRLATEMGWNNEEAAEAATNYLLNKEDSNLDQVIWFSEEAEGWLNENRRPEGLYWGWHESEFWLMGTEWWEKE